MEKFTAFARIAEIEFSDIILSTQDLGQKLRIYLKDKTFIDFFYTTRLKIVRFSIHWESTHINDSNRISRGSLQYRTGRDRSSTISASGFLQAYFQFCSGFARIGVFNFGSLGQTNKVLER